MKKQLYLGDNIESLKKLEDNSVDAVVTDSPYGLGKEPNAEKTLRDWIEKGYTEVSGSGFMGKKWDSFVPQPLFWKEVYRVLRPGGFVVSFFGTRTYDWGVMAMRLAGFEIRDQISYLYGSGFPKSLNVGKAIDKLQGNEREVVGKSVNERLNKSDNDSWDCNGLKKELNITKGNTEWEGFGSALKPAVEPICLARKPLSEKSIAENVLKWGTGGINIDGCRIGFNDDKPNQIDCKRNKQEQTGWASMGTLADRKNPYIPNNEGRFPANVILECICDEVIKGEKGEVKKSGGSRENCELSHEWGYSDIVRTNFTDKGDIHTNPDCPCYMLDKQSGVSKSRSKYPELSLDNLPMNHYEETKIKHISGREQTKEFLSDKGGASRFFYTAKVSKKERNMGLEGFEVEILSPTIKLLLKTDYNNKNFTWEREDLKTTPVDTDKLLQKDIEEYTITKDYKWNTELFGKLITDQFLMDTKYIIETATSSTTIYQTLNLLIQKNIKTYIQELNGLMVKDIKLVSDVENKNIKTTITLQKKDGYTQNVKLVELQGVLSINVKENKCGHPTLKPIKLMAYLCRLITPPNGVILDPFMGSGSTGIAALLEGFDFIGMEMDKDYLNIAEARIENFELYREFLKK